MEILVNKKTLIECVNGAGKIAGKNPALPILENIKLSIRKDGYLVGSGFDREVSVVRKFKLADSFEEPFEFCINPKDLGNLLKTLRDDEVRLVIENDSCDIHHAKGTTRLPVLPAEDFPAIEREKDAKKLTIRAEQLFNWLNNAGNFVSNDALRPMLAGIHLYVEGNEVGVASSDSQVLFSDNALFGMEETFSVSGTLITKAVSPLLDVINGEENVTISFGEKSLSFRTENAMLSCLKPVGAYPNFKRLIAKKENPTTIKVDKKELQDSVSRAILTANSTNCLLRLRLNDGLLSIDSEDLGFNKRSHEDCPCELEGEPMEIGVKGSNLVKCLNAIESETAIFEVANPRQSIIVYDDNCPKKAVLLMPLVLQ